jgi:predicted ATPase
VDPKLYDEIVSWLELMIPGTKLSKHEKMSKGAINLVNILISISNKPHIEPFIGLTLIDEPELGLHPKILIELVRKFREYSETNPIWITTHSETIVRCLKPNELFLVDMVDGETKIKHVNDCDTSNMPLNDMLLSNVLNGGLPY